MKIRTILGSLTSFRLMSEPQTTLLATLRIFSPRFPFSTTSESQELNEFVHYMEQLKNYERIGVPKGAGTDTDDGFDLDRMRRLLINLGSPQSKFKVQKEKGPPLHFFPAFYVQKGIVLVAIPGLSYLTSPHIRTIRERITLGTTGEPVSAKALSSHFFKIKAQLDMSVHLEGGHLSQFEVFTALAFSLFAEEKVDFAVIEAGLGGARDATNVIGSSDLAASIITNIGSEHLAALGGSLESIATAKAGIIKEQRPVVLGGPFLPHIERIIRDKALSSHSPIVSASDPGNRSVLKSFSGSFENPHQSCDILLMIERDLDLFIELFDVQLRLLGSHQIQNAATATCAALCLRQQGWALSNASIRAGLQSAYLLGRNQLLTPMEAEMLGLPGSTILLDGAHTKESAEALRDMIKMTFPKTRLVLVVAMANDKDHLGFARVLLQVGCLDAVCFTEVDIAGDRSRTASSSSLLGSWIQVCRDIGGYILERKPGEYGMVDNQYSLCEGKIGNQSILFMEGSVLGSIRCGNAILRDKYRNQHGIIVVTGSLHIVSAVLGLVEV